MSSERRKHPRIPVQLSMEARLVAEGINERGHVVDLNNAGAFIATEMPFEKNTPIEVELAVPGVECLPIKAVVARRTERVTGKRTEIPAGIGLVFLTDTVLERAFIQRAVLEALKDNVKITRGSLGGRDSGVASA